MKRDSGALHQPDRFSDSRDQKAEGELLDSPERCEPEGEICQRELFYDKKMMRKSRVFRIEGNPVSCKGD